MGDRLSTVITVMRGLLAEKTGDENAPYAPVTLKPVADGGGGDGLRVKVGDLPEDVEELRKELGAAIDKLGARPAVIRIEDSGLVLGVEAGGKGALGNKVALVTGGAGAIGYGICKGLLEQGCCVAGTDLAGEKLEKLGADLGQIGGERAMVAELDVTDEGSVARGFDEVIRSWGGVDIVVVNAGIAMVSFLKDMALEDFRRLERVNVEGALLTIQRAGRCFITQGTGGDIVVVSSKNVPSPGAGFGAYSATKAGCHQLGRIASLELAEYGVRVNMVSPDAVFSEGNFSSGLWDEIGPSRMAARGLNAEGLQEYYRGRNLLKVQVTGGHVANAVLFFVTRQTPTTGATIPVDGGLPDATPR